VALRRLAVLPLVGGGVAAVNDLFRARPAPFDLPDAESEAEVELRLGAMEEAMVRLYADGLFGSGPQRDGVMIAVEVMPPDHSNVQRVRRLNPPTAIGRWLAEAAEPAAGMGDPWVIYGSGTGRHGADRPSVPM
jgi:hypothetical protein